MIRHDIHWTLEELGRQHARSLKERLGDFWHDEIDRRLLLWVALTIFAFGCGYWLW